MKPTHYTLLLRVSCLRFHQTVFNKENSYHLGLRLGLGNLQRPSHNRRYHEELHRIDGRNIQAKIHAAQTFIPPQEPHEWQLRDRKKDFNI